MNLTNQVTNPKKPSKIVDKKIKFDMKPLNLEKLHTEVNNYIYI